MFILPGIFWAVYCSRLYSSCNQRLSYVIFRCFYYRYVFKAVVWLYSACKNTSAAILYIKTTTKKTNKQTTEPLHCFLGRCLYVPFFVDINNCIDVNKQLPNLGKANWLWIFSEGIFKSLSWRNDNYILNSC